MIFLISGRVNERKKGMRYTDGWMCGMGEWMEARVWANEKEE